MHFRADGQYPGITIVAVPKPFVGHIATIQKNALQSWARLAGVQRILLLGAEAGVEDAARSFGAVHIPTLGTDNDGVPRLDSVFEVASAAAPSERLCYVNSDILLLPEFIEAACTVASSMGDALVVSRRWNLEVREPIDFGGDWAAKLRKRTERHGDLFSPFGIDAFVFPKCMFNGMPPFSIGRFSWDNWLISDARRRGHPVVDVTSASGVIHQTHDYENGKSLEEMRRSPGALRNFWLAGDTLHSLASAFDATHELRNGSIVRSSARTISVVITGDHTPARLHRCIRTIAHQNYPRSYVEIVVVGQPGPSSGGWGLANLPFVKLTSEEKPGLASARNKGAAVATGDIIAFVDSGFSVAGDWMKEAKAVAERDGYRSIVVSNVRPGSSDEVQLRDYVLATFELKKSHIDGSPAHYCAGMMISSRTLRLVGPFDERLWDPACVDWDWLNRAFRRGVGISFASRSNVRLPDVENGEQLRLQVASAVRSDIQLARMRRDQRYLSRGSFLNAYTKAAAHELRAALAFRGRKSATAIPIVWLAMKAWRYRIVETWRHFNAPPRNVVRRQALKSF